MPIATEILKACSICLLVTACMPATDETPMDTPRPGTTTIPSGEQNGAILFSQTADGSILQGTVSETTANGETRLTISAGGKSVTVSGRYDANGNLRTSVGTFTRGQSVFTGDFPHSSFISGTISGSVTGDVMGFVGTTVSLPASLNSGTATYRGQSVSRVTVGGQVYEAISDDTRIALDFGTRRANLSARSVELTDASSRTTVTGVFDRFDIRDGRIESDRVTGGKFSAQLGTSNVQPLGGNVTSNMHGRFYGNDDGQPDEVSGSVSAVGATGDLHGLFATD